MRTSTVALVLAASLLMAPGCKRRSRSQIQQTEEEAPQLASVVHVADPRSSVQLVSGFYDVEQSAWRWTAGKFSLVLRVPRGAAEKGALLRLKFSLPEAVIERLKSVTVAASIGGTPLEPQTYERPGEHVYVAEVPHAALGRESVKVDFALDKSLPPGSVDQRELGVIVTSIGFESK
jgi:hypothetical protein